MSITRLYTPQPLVTGNTLELDAPSSHHISRVLRLKTKTAILIFNGNGYEYQATIKTISKSTVSVLLGTGCQPNRESALHITLGQGISRGERMDYSLQKSVELGVSRITPIWTQRTQVNLTGQRLEKRLAHWRGIIRSACEQSGRLALPELDSPVTLEDCCKTSHAGILKLLLDPGAKKKLGDVKPVSNKLIILIGSEGGFDQNEMNTADENGFTSVSLGPRILRTETAAVAALSALQTLWGDMG